MVMCGSILWRFFGDEKGGAVEYKKKLGFLKCIGF